jgi:hypothetical protein
MQTPYQWQNKGTYGHLGGILHAGLHAAVTYFILLLVALPELAFWLAILEGVIHYHIDWAKMNLNRKMGWKPDTHAEFWTLLGFDQFLHYLTYIFIIGIILTWN